MKQFRVVVSDNARIDLNNIQVYLSGFYTSTPKRFKVAFDRQIRLLKYNPYIHPIYFDNENYRYFIVHNYLAFYDLDEQKQKVEIYRVLPATQDIPAQL